MKPTSEADVRKMHKLRAEGLTLKQIGARFGLTENTVCRILRDERRAGVRDGAEKKAC